MAIALSGSAEVVAVGTTLRHQGLAAVSLHKGDLLAETSSSPPPRMTLVGVRGGGRSRSLVAIVVSITPLNTRTPYNQNMQGMEVAGGWGRRRRRRKRRSRRKRGTETRS